MSVLKLLEWQKAKDRLDEYKAKEKELRLAILDDLFPSAGEGSLSASVGRYIVKGSFKNSTTVSKEDWEERSGVFTEEQLACVNFKPSFLSSKFKLLDDEERFMVEECLTIKPALPTLTIKLIEDE